MKKEYIVTNAVKCAKCGDRIFSASVHDFRACRCGSICVDGGQEYLRRVGDYKDCIEESIIMGRDDFFFVVDSVRDARDYLEDNAQMLATVALRSLLNTNNLTVTHWGDVEKQLLTYHGDRVIEAAQWALDTGRNNLGLVNAVIRAVNEAGFLKNKIKEQA